MHDHNNITAHEERRKQSRAPHRRDGKLNHAEIVHIGHSLEASLDGLETPKQKRPEFQGNIEFRKNAEFRDDAESREERSFHAEEEFRREAERQARREFRANAQQQAEWEEDDDEEEDEPPRRRHIFRKLFLFLLVCCIGVFIYSFFFRQSGYYTVAVFGVDSRSGNLGKEALADVNIIARVDKSSGEIRLVSLYRDTYTCINADGKYHKLNEAYFRGGPEQAVWAVEHNTDVKIDDYAAFNWKAVIDAINLLGGVDLEITDPEFRYINAFITETVNSTGVGSVQLEHAGMNHLDGVQAVAYARLRLMDTDYQRTARQRKVIGLALEKAKAADYGTLAKVVAAVLPQISTSVTPDDLLPFAKGIGKYYIGETAGFPFDKTGADVGKLDCVIPVTLESNAIQLHAFLYPEESYTPSEGLLSISRKIISDTGLQ